MVAANAALQEANFGTCRSAATVRYLFRAAYELGRWRETPGESGVANLLLRRDFAAREKHQEIWRRGR